MPDKPHTFVTMFDSLGFECIVDITNFENKKLLATLRDVDEKVQFPVNLRHMVMRAQANPQRTPEIWSFTASEGIDQGILTTFAQESPQELADLIRECGNCIWKIEQTQPANKVIT